MITGQATSVLTPARPMPGLAAALADRGTDPVIGAPLSVRVDIAPGRDQCGVLARLPNLGDFAPRSKHMDGTTFDSAMSNHGRAQRHVSRKRRCGH